MSWSPKTKVLFCAFLLLATVVTVRVKALMPVAPTMRSEALMPNAVGPRPVSSDGLNMGIEAEKYPALATSFEFDSSWDKGALWDEEFPAYDLAQPGSALSRSTVYDEFELWGEPRK